MPLEKDTKQPVQNWTRIGSPFQEGGAIVSNYTQRPIPPSTEALGLQARRNIQLKQKQVHSKGAHLYCIARS